MTNRAFRNLTIIFSVAIALVTLVYSSELGSIVVAGRSGIASVARTALIQVWLFVAVLSVLAWLNPQHAKLNLFFKSLWFFCVLGWIVVGRTVTVWTDDGSVRVGWYLWNSVVVDADSIRCATPAECVDRHAAHGANVTFDMLGMKIAFDGRDPVYAFTGPFILEKTKDLLSCYGYTTEERSGCDCARRKIYCPGQTARSVESLFP